MDADLTTWDVAVLGAGPAGIAAALRLADAGLSVRLVESGRPFAHRPCPVDHGRRCHGCGGICNVISGFGGSVHYGDGVKLSKFPSGRRLQELLEPEAAPRLMADALDLLGAQDATFLGLAADNSGPYKDYQVASLSSTEVARVVERLHARVAAAEGVRLDLRTAARDIQAQDGGGFVIELEPTTDASDTVVHAQRLFVAVGRRGQRWWRKQVRRLGLRHTLPVPSVGIRFECPLGFLAPATAIHPDLKTTLVRAGVKVKTFCLCAGSGGGRVKFTDYGDHTLLDGHVVEEPGGTVGNIALLAQLRDEQGAPRTQDWIEQHLLQPYRGLRHDRPGKPVLQWYPDFRAGTVTCGDVDEFTRRSGVRPSAADVQVANLASVLGADVHAALCSAFEDLLASLQPKAQRHPAGLERVGVLGLELESLWDELALTTGMESSLPGLYACGDCAGLAQGILQATVSGLAAAEDVIGAVARAGSWR